MLSVHKIAWLQIEYQHQANKQADTPDRLIFCLCKIASHGHSNYYLIYLNKVKKTLAHNLFIIINILLLLFYCSWWLLISTPTAPFINVKHLKHCWKGKQKIKRERKLCIKCFINANASNINSKWNSFCNLTIVTATHKKYGICRKPFLINSFFILHSFVTLPSRFLSLPPSLISLGQKWDKDLIFTLIFHRYTWMNRHWFSFNFLSL